MLPKASFLVKKAINNRIYLLYGRTKYPCNILINSKLYKWLGLTDSKDLQTHNFTIWSLLLLSLEEQIFVSFPEEDSKWLLMENYVESIPKWASGLSKTFKDLPLSSGTWWVKIKFVYTSQLLWIILQWTWGC